MPTRSEAAWLEAAQAQIISGAPHAAHALLVHARAEYPDSANLARAHAGALQQIGRIAEAEAILQRLLIANPGDIASAFASTGILVTQGHMAAAAATLHACAAAGDNRRDADLAISAIDLLCDHQRIREAAAIAGMSLAENAGDARLHAYMGMLSSQLGDFAAAREHLVIALEATGAALEWHAAIGLAHTLRYTNPDHPDLTRFRDALHRNPLSARARAELHFALGKAHDDFGDYPEAARQFQQGNAIARQLTPWSGKRWNRAVEARLATRGIPAHRRPDRGFVPIFIVGMPRSGSTLLAELLSANPGVCNRGELECLGQLAQQPSLSGIPSLESLDQAATVYTRQSRQDDAQGSSWFIDKNPLNFRYIDLALAMFPDAKIIYCRRNARDTALSLWTQYFREPIQAYSNEFSSIAAVMRDCRRLMTHWLERFPDSICEVRYEDLVANPQAVPATLAAWIGTPVRPVAGPSHDQDSVISTASLWQARQPVHMKSIGRWQNYAQLLPALSGIASA